jgi:hypothetical protein
MMRDGSDCLPPSTSVATVKCECFAGVCACVGVCERAYTHVRYVECITGIEQRQAVALIAIGSSTAGECTPEHGAGARRDCSPPRRRWGRADRSLRASGAVAGPKGQRGGAAARARAGPDVYPPSDRGRRRGERWQCVTARCSSAGRTTRGRTAVSSCTPRSRSVPAELGKAAAGSAGGGAATTAAPARRSRVDRPTGGNGRRGVHRPRPAGRVPARGPDAARTGSVWARRAMTVALWGGGACC